MFYSNLALSKSTTWNIPCTSTVAGASDNAKKKNPGLQEGLFSCYPWLMAGEIWPLNWYFCYWGQVRGDDFKKTSYSITVQMPIHVIHVVCNPIQWAPKVQCQWNTQVRGWRGPGQPNQQLFSPGENLLWKWSRTASDGSPQQLRSSMLTPRQPWESCVSHCTLIVQESTCTYEALHNYYIIPTLFACIFACHPCILLHLFLFAITSAALTYSTATFIWFCMQIHRFTAFRVLLVGS